VFLASEQGVVSILAGLYKLLWKKREKALCCLTF
jgi:hypothetical protein